MLAEIPLELRSRLGLALFALGRLAEEVGVQPSPAATVNSLVAGLKDPFLFVVAGEVNSGKSMLLNALFGEEFCPTSALPMTDKIRYFRHGFARQEIAFTPEIQEIRVPLPFLQDFHIVDTPGVNSVAEGHEAITEQFLPRADAVLFVLPVTNPWGAKCWEFLARIHQQLGKRIVLVLSQIDLRSEMEVAAILEHLHLCLKKYLGRDLPVFPVSAREALLARTTGVGKQELMAQSRFQPLESYLNQILTETDARRERLGNTLRMGNILLGHIQSRLGEKAGKLNTFGDAMRKIGQAVQTQKEETWKACLETLPKLSESLTAASQQFPSRPSSPVEPPAGAAWIQAAQKALEQQTDQVGQQLTKDQQHLWRQTRVTMDVALGRRVAEPASFTPEVENLRQAHKELLLPLQDGAAWTEALSPVVQAGQQAQRKAWILAGLGIAAAGAGGAASLGWLIVSGIALCLLALGLLRWGKRTHTAKYHRACAELAGTETARVHAGAEAALHTWLHQTFQAFSAHYKPLLEVCEQTRLQQESRLQEVEAARKNLADLSNQLLTP